MEDVNAARSPTRFSLESIRGFALDLDGTIWAGPTMLAGAAEFVADVRRAGIPVVFASNSSRCGGEILARKLTAMGIPAADKDVVAAFDLVGDEVHRRIGPARILSLGTLELADRLESVGHTVVTLEDGAEAQVVVVGNDPAFDFARLRVAARAVAAGALFVAVNMDARFPVGEDTFDPGNGALAEAVAVASGVRPVVVGKPYPPMFEVTLARLGCTPGEAAMVGDNLPSDIAGGREAGMRTIWIQNSSEPHRREADLRIESLVALHQLWRAGREG